MANQAGNFKKGDVVKFQFGKDFYYGMILTTNRRLGCFIELPDSIKARFGVDGIWANASEITRPDSPLYYLQSRDLVVTVVYTTSHMAFVTPAETAVKGGFVTPIETLYQIA